MSGMPDSKTTFLSPEEACSAVKTEELKQPEKQDVLDETLSGCTPNQKRYLIYCLTHPHLTDKERYLKAGYAAGSGTPAGLKQIEGKLGDLMFSIGITGKDLANGIKDGLTATKVVFRKKPIYEKGKSGKVVGYKDTTVEVPDQTTRHKTRELLIKSGNYLPQKVKKHQHDHSHTLRVGGAPMQVLRQREAKLTEQIEGDFEVVESTESVAS